jgi:hypothetical protein
MFHKGHLSKSNENENQGKDKEVICFWCDKKGTFPQNMYEKWGKI